MSEPNEEQKTPPAEFFKFKPLPERLPNPTVWPITLSFGATLLAFGLVTHWLISAAGMIIFFLGWAGWFEDLRNDQCE